jgi:chloride channel protein, CIC family
MSPERTRWFSHQPNVPGRGILAGYSPRFWMLVIAVGIVTGVAGSLLLEILKLVERASWSYHSGTFLQAVKAAPGWRHVAILAGAALIVGLGVLGLGRLPGSGGREVPESLWLHQARLPFLPSITRGLLTTVTVGMGVSLGREAGPQLAGAATASRLEGKRRDPAGWRRVVFR